MHLYIRSSLTSGVLRKKLHLRVKANLDFWLVPQASLWAMVWWEFPKLYFASMALGLVFILSGCTSSFIESSSTFPPGTVSTDFPDYDHYSEVDPSVSKLPTELMGETLTFLEKIFQMQSFPDMKCGGGRVFQKFVDMYFQNSDGKSPQVRFICLTKFAATDDQIEWVLSDAPNAIWKLLPPKNLFNLDFSDVASIQISSDSFLRLTVIDARVFIAWSGVTLNLSAKSLAGTGFSWIPESLLSFEVESIQAMNDGVYTINLRLPFGIPYAYTGALKIIAAKNKSIRFKNLDLGSPHVLSK